jgi:hypothetical protein
MGFWKTIVKPTGDIYFHKYPMFVTYKPSMHKIKGNEIRDVMKKVKPADILLRRFDGYLNTLLTGYWGHAALYVGYDDVIHAVSKGVICDDILDFCRADSICILTRKDRTVENVEEAIACARSLVNIAKYDYEADADDDEYYCTEFVDKCNGGLFKDDYKQIRMFNKSVLLPDGIYNSKHVDIVYEFRGNWERVYI